jgi:threonine aldolase
LGTELWLTNARHANSLAKELYEGLKQRPYVTLTQECQANAVFVKIPKEWIGRLRERYFFYVWDEKTFECRLMTTFDTTSETVSGFLKALDELDRERK